MKIKNINIDQFANITDFKTDFDDGINVIVGNNESGKSTVVEFIYQSLFNNEKIEDKYLAMFADGTKADYADGTIEIEKDSEICKINKHWTQKDVSIKMQHDGGPKIENKQVNIDKLNSLLPYKKGVYRELVFKTQKNDSQLMDALFSVNNTRSQKEKENLKILQSDITSSFASAISVAGGGLTLKQMKDLVNEQITKLEQKWDKNKKGPDEKTFKDYKDSMPPTGIKDSVTEGWYKKHLSELNYKKTKDAETDYEKCLKNKEIIMKSLEAENSRLKEVIDSSGSITNKKILNELIAKSDKYISDKDNWNKLKKELDEYTKLDEEYKYATSLERFNQINSKKKEYEKKLESFKTLKEIDNNVIKKVEKLDNEINKETNKLNSLNLELKLNNISDNVIIKSLINDNVLSKDTDSLSIKEAINITVPGVLDIDILPEGLNIEEIKNNIDSYRKDIDEIFRKYEVSGLDGLNKLLEQYQEHKNLVEKLKKDYESTIGDDDYDTLKAGYDTSITVRTSGDIENDIKVLTKGEQLDVYGGIIKKDLKDYDDEYKTLKDLEGAITNLQQEITTLQASITVVPDSLKDIENIDEYKDSIQQKIRELEEKRTESEDELRQAFSNLPETSSEELELEVKKWSKYYDDILTEYNNWLNIKDKLDKFSPTGDKTDDVKKAFNKYLSIISDNKIQTNDLDKDLNLSMVSGKYALRSDYLSAGSKETVEFAFRLAVLESLFPEGGGLLVLDDSFTNMDPNRKKEACDLINEFATKNQVIFVTCTPEYDRLLNINKTINM